MPDSIGGVGSSPARRSSRHLVRLAAPAQHHPDLLPRYEELYERGAYMLKPWRRERLSGDGPPRPSGGGAERATSARGLRPANPAEATSAHRRGRQPQPLLSAIRQRSGCRARTRRRARKPPNSRRGRRRYPPTGAEADAGVEEGGEGAERGPRRAREPVRRRSARARGRAARRRRPSPARRRSPRQALARATATGRPPRPRRRDRRRGPGRRGQGRSPASSRVSTTVVAKAREGRSRRADSVSLEVEDDEGGDRGVADGRARARTRADRLAGDQRVGSAASGAGSKGSGMRSAIRAPSTGGRRGEQPDQRGSRRRAGAARRSAARC